MLSIESSKALSGCAVTRDALGLWVIRSMWASPVELSALAVRRERNSDHAASSVGLGASFKRRVSNKSGAARMR